MFPPDCYTDFEAATATWELDYERNEAGSYVEDHTGIVFGSFALGWMMRDARK